MSELKLRLAIRDLYRGDGGPLSSYDEGWNDGTDAAAEVFSAEIERLAEALRDVWSNDYISYRHNLKINHADALRDAGVSP